MRLCTNTGLRWPTRCTRSVACCSTAGFHQRSKWKTWFAAGRLRPRPPALIEITSTDGPSGRSRTPRAALRAAARSAGRGRSRPRVPSRSCRCGTSRSKPGYCVKTSALSPAGTCSSSSTSRSSLPERPSSGWPVAQQHLRVVAHLLQLARASRAPRRAGRTCPRAPRSAASSGRPSPGRGSPARPSACSSPSSIVIGGSSSSTSGVVLRAPQDERPHDAAQPLERLLVAVRLDRPRERAVEPLARAEQPRVDDVHDRPQLARAGSRSACPSSRRGAAR